MIKNTLAVFGGICLIVLVLIFTDFGDSRVRVYDCGMADWHPDIPVEVKEECRRIRYEEWKRQNDKNRI